MTLLLRILKPCVLGSTEGVVQIPDHVRQAATAQEASCQSVAEPDGLRTLIEQELGKAREEGTRLADEIVRRGNEQYEERMQQAQQDAAALQTQAWQRGYDEGARQKVEDIQTALDQIGQLLEQLQNEHQAYLRKYERELKDFALEIASKILTRQLDEDECALSGMIVSAMANLRDADWISVEISDQLPRLVERLETELAGQNRRGQSVDILLKDLPRDAAFLQTPDCVVDLSLSTQLKMLQTLLNDADG